MNFVPQRFKFGDGNSCAIGVYTLRCAINYANKNPGTYIRFATALSVIQLQSALPAITAEFTWIDGHDQSNGCACPYSDGSLMTTGRALTINANLRPLATPPDQAEAGNTRRLPMPTSVVSGLPTCPMASCVWM